MKQFKIQQTLTDRSEKSVEKYFNEVNRQSSITSEEEVELTKKIKQGDKLALDKLVNANLKFVISVAKKYQSSGVPLSDLISEGNYGLIKAAHKFDETKGFKFISYAVWWIRQSILQSISENKRLIKVPSNKNSQTGQFLNAFSDLMQALEREPTEYEISEYMDIEVENVKMLYNATKSHSSLDSKVGDTEDSSSLIDLIEDEFSEKPETSLINESLSSDLFRTMNILSEKERNVIIKHYGIGCKPLSKEEIAKEMSYTTERIRQLLKGAERKLSKNYSAKKLLVKYF
jgi:RNA polymerase primary sigma factor